MDQEVQFLSSRIMVVLAMKTSGKAQRVLMSIQNEMNGLAGWRRLVKMGEGGALFRRQGLLSAILTYDFGKYDPQKSRDGTEVLDRILQFEALVAEYDSSAQSPFDETCKIATVINGMNDKKLHDHLLSKQFGTYEDMKTYIENYYDLRRGYTAPTFSGTGKNDKVYREHDDMEIDAFHKDKGKGKGKHKGKGKDDKGKGKCKHGKGKGGKSKHREEH
jgi:hypothetical protein